MLLLHLSVVARDLGRPFCDLLCCVALRRIIGLVWGVTVTIESFDWEKYKHSPKIQFFIDKAKIYGIKLTSEELKTFQAQILLVINNILAFSEGTVLCILMFFFMIIALLDGIHDQSKPRYGGVQRLVQKYLFWKTLISSIVGTLVGIFLAILGVDLAAIFGIVAFAMNFLPTLGSWISVLAPLPLVLLDPDKSLQAHTSFAAASAVLPSC